MMNIKLLIFTSCVSVLLLSCNESNNKKVISGTESTELLFPKGEVVTNNNFKGKTWLKSLIEPDSLNPVAVGNVSFEAGSRTNWHLHPGGQILLATGGTGYYQEKGSEIKVLHKGDVIKCPPNVVHWHGASPDDEFTQVAITTRQAGPTKWLEPVTDEEYRKK